MWTNEWGNEFDNEQDARLDVPSRMSWDDYKNELMYSISFDELIDWARDQIGFESHFSEQLKQAEDEFFENNYYEDDYSADYIGYDV